MKQYGKAKSMLLENLRTKNKAPDWYYLSKIYSVQNLNDSARMSFSKVSDLGPKNAIGIISTATRLQLEGNNSQALDLIAKAKKSSFSDKDILPR